MSTKNNRARLHPGRSPPPAHLGPATATPGQASGVSHQVRRRTAGHPDPYIDVSDNGERDAVSYSTPGSAAHYPAAGTANGTALSPAPRGRSAHKPGALLSPYNVSAGPQGRFPACPDSTQATSSHPVHHHQQQQHQYTGPSKSPDQYEPTWFKAARAKQAPHTQQQPSNNQPQSTAFAIPIPPREPGTCESSSAFHRQAGHAPDTSPLLSPSNKSRNRAASPRTNTPPRDNVTLNIPHSPLPDSTPYPFTARLMGELSAPSTGRTDTYSVEDLEVPNSYRNIFNPTPRGFNDNTRESDETPPPPVTRHAFAELDQTRPESAGQNLRRPTTPTNTNRVYSVANPQGLLTPGLLDIEQSVTTPPLPARPRPSPEQFVGANSSPEKPHALRRPGSATPPAAAGGSGGKSVRSAGRSGSPALGFGAVFGGKGTFFSNSSPVDKSIHIQPVLAPSPEGGRAQGNVDPSQSVHIQPVLAVSSGNMTPRLGSAGGHQQQTPLSGTPMSGAASGRRVSTGSAALAAHNVALGATAAPSRHGSVENAGSGVQVAISGAGASRRGSVESAGDTALRSASGRRGSAEGSGAPEATQKAAVAAGAHAAGVVSASTNSAVQEALEVAAAALAGTVATGARTPTPLSARTSDNMHGPRSGPRPGPRSGPHSGGGPRSTPRLNARQPASVPEDSPAIPISTAQHGVDPQLPEGSPAKLRPKPKPPGKAQSAQQQQQAGVGDSWMHWWTGGANPGNEGASGAAGQNKDPPGATPMHGSIATTATDSTAATKSEPHHHHPIGSRLLTAFGRGATGSHHTTAPEATDPTTHSYSTSSQAPAVRKRGPTLNSIALASIVLDGGSPSPPSGGPLSSGKSPRVPPPGIVSSPRRRWNTDDENTPATKALKFRIPNDVSHLPPDSPRRVALDILKAQGLARETCTRSSIGTALPAPVATVAAAAAAAAAAQPSLTSVAAERSTASDMLLTADASILNLPLPPGTAVTSEPPLSVSHRTSNGQSNSPSHQHRRSQSAEAIAAAYLHSLSQSKTQGPNSLNLTPGLATTPQPHSVNTTPRTNEHLKNGPKSARQAYSPNPMHADDPSADVELTRMQSAAAALRSEKSGMSRGGSTLHNEPSTASTGVVHMRPRHQYSHTGVTARSHLPSPRQRSGLATFPRISSGTDLAGLDTVAGVGLPGEASGYSDVSGLRTEQSAMSTRGYVGYVTGGLGDTVLEESDMREILAGGKSRMEGGDQDGEEKQGMEPVLQELNDTNPFFLISLVARFPVMSMFLLFCLLCACAAPAALPAYRPRTNNDFASLLVRDHVSAANVFGDESFSQFNSFWHLEKDPSDRIPTTAEKSDNNADSAAAPATARKAARRLADFNSILHNLNPVQSVSDSVIGMEGSGSIEKVMPLHDVYTSHLGSVGGTGTFHGSRELSAATENGKVGGDGLRTEITTMLNIFYRYSDNSTAITEDMVKRSRELEQKIIDHSVWKNICRQQEDGRCHAPASFATVVYATEIESGASEPLYEIADKPQRDMHETALKLVANNFTLFFDLNTDGKHADYLHTIVMLSEPRGNSDYFDTMMPDLLKLFTAAQSDDVIINFGEDSIIARQVDLQLLRDSYWAGLSLLCAAIMLRLGAGSTFLTIAGVFQLVVAFPISWLAYAVPRGWQYINFLHFLAPFVVLGIGLDDIFVFVSFFEDTRPYARHFALDTRLSRTFSRASGACLATSTTSAFAFAANVFSPVPAVQSFGLLLATLVLVNYVLAITWLPVCLAAWDKHIMFPALARADEAANFGSQAPKKGPFAALCCCLETVSTDNFRMSIRPGGFVLRAPPRVLEYGRVAWPFLKAPEQHRLATPRGKRSLMLVPEPEFRQQSWMESKMNASFKWVFDGVFKFRWLAVLLVICASVAGGLGAVNLTEPPTSEPPLFHMEHNVQFFWRYQNSEQADNIPVCTQCAKPLAESLADPVGLTKTLGVFSTIPATIIWGLTPDGIDNTPNVEGDPVGLAQINPLTFDTSFDLSKPKWQLLVQRQMADLFEASKVATGVEAVDNVTETTGANDMLPSTAVQPTNHRRDLVGALQRNPLAALKEFCGGVAEVVSQWEATSEPEPEEDTFPKPYCDQLHNETGLPTGDDFHHAVFRMIAAGDGMQYRTMIGYEWPEQSAEWFMERSNAGTRKGPWPEVKWLKVAVLTATVKSSAPQEVEKSYREWEKWADFIQEDEPYKGLFISSPDWVTAVTHTKISSSIHATVLLSVCLAAIVVFVFCGRPLLTLIATLTVVMTNLSVMGLMYVWGWHLGAIEGMSITSLVGLSVDFCIHLCEGYMHGKAQDRFGKAREAFALVGIPMAASGISTVATCLPLFATKTVILNRFAAVLSVTMGIGLLYVLLFLAPMMGMFGPLVTKTRAPVTASVLSRSMTVLLNSKAVRFILVCIFALVTLMIAPAANNYMNFTGPLADLGKMLFGLVGIAFAIVLVRSGMKIAAQHREARVTLHEMAIVEEASRRLPPGLTDTCTSSRLAAYHPGLKSEMTTATGFGMSTV